MDHNISVSMAYSVLYSALLMLKQKGYMYICHTQMLNMDRVYFGTSIHGYPSCLYHRNLGTRQVAFKSLPRTRRRFNVPFGYLDLQYL